jgi:cyclopropane fatty-acyl-phospholipid synthase-like methyltransferase
LTEWLTDAMDLRSGMRVLDLGSGRGTSSVFLHREFGVQVWSVDLWFDPGERLARFRDAGVDDAVFPLRADARSLPFAPGFFDAVVSVDSFVYYGTDADRGRHLGYVRAVARRRADVEPEAPITSLPTEYVKRPVLRG